MAAVERESDVAPGAVQLFGGLRVTIDGEPIDVVSGITTAVIARLACTPGTAVTAETLAADLRDEPTEGAINTLRSHFEEVEGSDSAKLRQPLKQGLSAAEWDAFHAEGERMTFRQAVDLALSLAPGDAYIDPTLIRR